MLHIRLILLQLDTNASDQLPLTCALRACLKCLVVSSVSVYLSDLPVCSHVCSMFQLHVFLYVCYIFNCMCACTSGSAFVTCMCVCRYKAVVTVDDSHRTDSKDTKSESVQRLPPLSRRLQRKVI